MNKILNELLPTISIKQHDEQKISATFTASKAFVGFQGHFPEQPVMPCICMFELVRALLFKQKGILFKLKKVGNSKFFTPIVNDETIQMDAILTIKKDNLLHVKTTLKKGNEQKATLSLFFMEDNK